MMYFSFLLWASVSAAIQPGLSSSNVLCFILIVGIVSFEQINQSINHILVFSFSSRHKYSVRDAKMESQCRR